MGVSGRYEKTRVAAGIVGTAYLSDGDSVAAVLYGASRYFDYTIDIFGTERCMFEHNIPVDRISTSYNILWNAFKKLTVSYSPQERAQLVHDPAFKTEKPNNPIHITYLIYFFI